MDNLTHSLAGLALGELIDRALPHEPDRAAARTRRRALLVTGALASNFPDLDLVLTPLLAAPLGYLMHHRGHTHTLLFGLPQAALLLALLYLLWPRLRRLLHQNAVARGGILLSSVLGIMLHLSFDALNVYGVHPFHPFDARWVYGDMVFIVEPVFWISLGTALALLGARWSRWAPLAVLWFTTVSFAWQGFLQWGSLALLASIAGVVALASKRGQGVGLVAAVLACLAFVGIQAGAAQMARGQIRAALAGIEPGSRILDLPLSAFPSNPLCWAFATVTSDGRKDRYTIRVGVLSLAPHLNPVSSCPARFGGVPGTGAGALAWKFEESGSLAGLQALRRGNCHFDAWLRFARVPLLREGAATDVRFGAPDQPNFSTLPYAALAGRPCPSPVPSWGRPRADLLGQDTD